MRARLTDNPAAYRLSSCPANLGQRTHSALTPHPCWLALGRDQSERSNAYRALLDKALLDELLASIRLHLQQLRALGHDAFRAMVEAKTHRFALRASGPRIGAQAERRRLISEPDPVIWHGGACWSRRSPLPGGSDTGPLSDIAARACTIGSPNYLRPLCRLGCCPIPCRSQKTVDQHIGFAYAEGRVPELRG